MNKNIKGYTITSYKEGYIQQQYEIGADIFNKWPMGGQTKIEQLENDYALPKFDPTTRLYAFKNNKMQGFITCAIIPENKKKAYFEWPFIRKKHRKILEPILINEAMEVLRKKGIKTLITRAGNYWGRTRDLAETYGFTYKNDLVRNTTIDLQNLQTIKNTKEVREYNYEKDAKALLKQLREKGINEATAKIRVEKSKFIIIGKQLKNPWDIPYHYVTNLIAKKQEEITARAVTIYNKTFGEDTIVLMEFLAKNKKLEQQLLQKIKTTGYKKMIIHTGPWGMPDKFQKQWEEKGAEFYRQLAYYELKF